jgi:hypothetical protein
MKGVFARLQNGEGGGGGGVSSESACFQELSRAAQRDICYPEGVECVNCYN